MNMQMIIKLGCLLLSLQQDVWIEHGGSSIAAKGLQHVSTAFLLELFVETLRSKWPISSAH